MPACTLGARTTSGPTKGSLGPTPVTLGSTQSTLGPTPKALLGYTTVTTMYLQVLTNTKAY